MRLDVEDYCNVHADIHMLQQLSHILKQQPLKQLLRHIRDRFKAVFKQYTRDNSTNEIPVHANIMNTLCREFNYNIATLQPVQLYTLQYVDIYGIDMFSRVYRQLYEDDTYYELSEGDVLIERRYDVNTCWGIYYNDDRHFDFIRNRHNVEAIMRSL